MGETETGTQTMWKQRHEHRQWERKGQRLKRQERGSVFSETPTGILV